MAQLKAGILQHVDALDTLQGVTVTAGRLNLDAAVRWVAALPNFRLEVTGTGAQTVTAGGAVPYALSVVAVNGFVDTVTFAATGLPASATAMFTPPAFSGASDVTLTVLTSPATPASSYTITVTGTSGTLVHSATVTLTVLPGSPDFRLTARTKARVTPSMVDAPGSATLTIEATRMTPPGRMTLTLVGRSAGVSRTVSLDLDVTE